MNQKENMMSDLIVTQDANGFVQSVEKVETATKKCLHCKRTLALSAFVSDGRITGGYSVTCKSCRALGIITKEEAKAGKPLSVWSMGLNAKVNKPTPPPTPVEKISKEESPEQKVLAALALITESLNRDERMTLVRMLKALHGAE
jgi:hypothetical protein